MQIIISIFCLCLVSVAFAEWTYYDQMLDEIDPEPIVTSDQYLKEYIDCFMDRNNCDDISGRIKSILQDSIVTSCSKCSPNQKYCTRRFYEEFQRRYPEQYVEYQTKYDPTGKYMESLLKSIASARTHSYVQVRATASSTYSQS